MADKNINELFEVIAPTKETKERLLNKIMIENETKFKVNVKDNKVTNGKFKRWFYPSVACLMSLIILTSVISLVGDGRKIMIYAFGTDVELTGTGVELSTGTIADDGEMVGQLLQVYVDGKDISEITFYCKNQYIDFYDWTEKRENYNHQKGFKIPYGSKEDYKQLVIYWNPSETINQLTNCEEVGIKELESHLRNDLIIMQVNFANGTSTVKAININLQDDGKIVASIDDYNLTKEELNQLQEMQQDQAVVEEKAEEEIQGENLDEEKLICVDYYEKQMNLKVLSIEEVEDSDLMDQTYEGYTKQQLKAFKVYVAESEIPREIILGKNDVEQEWKVLNEGY